MTNGRILSQLHLLVPLDTIPKLHPSVLVRGDHLSGPVRLLLGLSCLSAAPSRRFAKKILTRKRSVRQKRFGYPWFLYQSVQYNESVYQSIFLLQQWTIICSQQLVVMNPHGECTCNINKDPLNADSVRCTGYMIKQLCKYVISTLWEWVDVSQKDISKCVCVCVEGW